MSWASRGSSVMDKKKNLRMSLPAILLTALLPFGEAGADFKLFDSPGYFFSVQGSPRTANELEALLGYL